MGAWDQIYREGVGGAGTPAGYAILSFKQALVRAGYGDALDLAKARFGGGMLTETRRYQHDHGLQVDGEIGPLTAASLLAPIIGAAEASYDIPDMLVCRIARLESALDPGAVGVSDPADHGLLQINALAHPEVTIADAFDAAWSIGYAAASVLGAYRKLGDWSCAVAAWNVGGGGASDWCSMNKPHTGGPPWSPNLFERATQYVALVRSQPPC